MDLAFVLDEAIPAGRLRSALTEAGDDLLERLELFDEFRGDAIGEGNKSLAWSVVLRAPDHTLSDDEVNALVTEAITETGATGMPGMGAVMKIVQPKTAGRADG